MCCWRSNDYLLCYRTLNVSGTFHWRCNDYFFVFQDTLAYLNVSGNMLVNLPAEVFQCTQLEELEADNIELTELPEDIGNFTKLKVNAASLYTISIMI